MYIGPKEEIFAVEMPEGVDGLGQAVLGQFPANSLPGSFSPYCEFKFAQKYRVSFVPVLNNILQWTNFILLGKFRHNYQQAFYCKRINPSALE